jgi:chaperonin GroEL
MPAKEVELHENARARVISGATLLAEAARVTLGPRGRNVLIQRSWGAPTITKDGVTVVKEIELEDRFENMGAKIIREVAQKTADDAGDGTTTATVLARAIIRGGLKLLAAGMPPMELRRGIEAAVHKAKEAIGEMARPIKDNERMAQVATVAANGDESIGKIVAEAMDKVGKDGSITVEEARGLETTLEVLEGMRFAQGYLSPYFVTNQDKLTAELEEPLILLRDGKISSVRELVPLLEMVVRAGRSLLAIADEVEGEALAAMVLNKLRGTLKAAAVKPPLFGEERKRRLEDIAILSGGIVISSELGFKLENVQMNQLGRCRRAVVDREQTLLIGCQGKKAEIQGRVAMLRKQLEETTSDYDREKLQERIAKLSGGVAVIRVGAATEPELKEKKARVDDAVHALRAATEEGIVAGGGVALVRVASQIGKLKLSEAQKAGADLVARAMKEPLRQIVQNAGLEPSVVYNKVAEGDGDFGFNALTLDYQDLVKAGVIDPAKVVRCALENAASAAAMFITTEAAVAEKPKKKRAMPAPPVSGMDGLDEMGGDEF